MIKPIKGLNPIHVNYTDNGSADIYNLSEDQYNRLWESLEDATESVAPFEVEQLYGAGYIPDVVATLEVIYGFTTESI